MWQALAVGAAAFPALFALSLRSLAALAPAWSVKERLVFSSRLVSSIQAAMATLSGILVILHCKDVVHDRHWLARDYMAVVISYMSYDICVMYLCHWHKGAEKGAVERKYSLASVQSFLRKERLMVTHHLFILIVLTPVAMHFRGELGDFFVGCIFTAELSTPFVSLGKILMQGQLLPVDGVAPDLPPGPLHGPEGTGALDHVPEAGFKEAVSLVKKMKAPASDEERLESCGPRKEAFVGGDVAGCPEAFGAKSTAKMEAWGKQKGVSEEATSS